MKILVTGAKGLLGAELVRNLSEGNVVMGFDKGHLDIRSLDQTLKVIQNTRPELIINCAAYTDVDGCESNEDLAFAVNGLGPRNLAVACGKYDASLMHISTDYVFNGTGSIPFREYDPTGSTSIYGRSKLMGENNVRCLCSRHFIIRTSWLFGENGPNFVKAILKKAKTGEPLTVVNDQIGSPTYAADLANAIRKLILEPAYGTYHLTNSGQCSWYQFALDILDLMGLNNEVTAISSETLARPAKRPSYSVLENYNWRLMGYQLMRNYKEALKEFLSNIEANVNGK